MSFILGVRAEPASVHWAIVTGDQEKIVLHASGCEDSPRPYSEAESLAWIRQRVVHILDTYKPDRVAVRYPEPTAKGANKNSAKERSRVEGVVLEAAGARNLEVVTGAMNTFGKFSGSRSPKEELASDEFRNLDWSKYRDSKTREAIFVAAALLPPK
jgi:Holliday junction resolvasome RuvABC endonuclease subunit